MWVSLQGWRAGKKRVQGGEKQRILGAGAVSDPCQGGAWPKWRRDTEQNYGPKLGGGFFWEMRGSMDLRLAVVRKTTYMACAHSLQRPRKSKEKAAAAEKSQGASGCIQPPLPTLVRHNGARIEPERTLPVHANAVGIPPPRNRPCSQIYRRIACCCHCLSRPRRQFNNPMPPTHYCTALIALTALPRFMSLALAPVPVAPDVCFRCLNRSGLPTVQQSPKAVERACCMY